MDGLSASELADLAGTTLAEVQRLVDLGILVVRDDARPGEVALVLDDYHLIRAPAVHHSLALPLERLPPSLRLLVGSRADPPLPLARLRARGELTGPLSERGLEVLELLAAGRSNREIAAELVVALDTVKKHVSHVLGKLGVANRARELQPLG
jgi:ATP/maltotriose-dependent transcriptional regulator MalT